MERGEFNSVGIDGRLDWPRIRQLMRIGLFAACLVFIGDWLLGCGVPAEGSTGLTAILSASAGKPDSVYAWGAALGLLGIVIEGLSYFSVYRLMAEKSPRHAHNLRTGIIGCIAFGACGVHVPCAAAMWLYSCLSETDPEAAEECCTRFCLYFFLPACVLFAVFFLVMTVTQISAFAKGLTPYPKWCWIFNVGFGMLLTFLLTKPFEQCAWGNALSAAWISIGNLWQFGGLLLMMKKAQANAGKAAE